MSQTIGLITPNSCDLHILELILQEAWAIDHMPRESGKVDLQIQLIGTGDEALYVSISELNLLATAEEYSGNEDLPEQFRGAVHNSRFYSIAFNSLELAKDVMRILLNGLASDINKLWIDDDYGRVMPAADFLENLATIPGWDWRHSS